MINLVTLPDEYRYTMSEVASVSGVSEMNIRNWMSRDTISIGLKHKLGRWLFCPKDAVRLRVIGDLTAIGSMPPAESNTIADDVVGRLELIIQPNANGSAPFVKAGRDWERLRIFIFRDGEEVQSRKFMGTSDDYRWAPGSGSDYPWFNRPHLVIPADEICFEVMLQLYIIDAADAGQPVKLEQLMEANSTGLSRREVFDKVDLALDEVDDIAGLTSDEGILGMLDEFATHLKKLKGDLIHRSEKGLRDEK